MLNELLVPIGSYQGDQSTFMAEENVITIRLNITMVVMLQNIIKWKKKSNWVFDPVKRVGH